MKVPFLDLKANYNSVKAEVLKEINDVLENTAYILGPKVQRFEEEFAQAHDVKHCIGVSTGTDANHLVLWANGIGPGDEVIVPANTFIASAWGITLCGATPVFVDCESGSYNIDPEKVRVAITKKTKAIVAVHLYGQTANFKPLSEIAQKNNILLFEDAAQAHLAEYQGKKAGGLSIAASFSFYPGKNLGAYGEGGAVTTNDEHFATKLKAMRDQGQAKKYYHSYLGHNYRMEAIQGAVLSVKLKHLHKWTELRRKVAEKYRSLLSDIEEIKLPMEMPYSKHVYHLFVIQLENRDEMQKHLNEKGVATGLHYPVPLHLQECFKSLGYKKGNFPETEKLADNCLSLPIYPELTDEQINYVSNTVRAYFKASVLS